jgi:putative salt-induced outer membrane protein YdiY
VRQITNPQPKAGGFLKVSTIEKIMDLRILPTLLATFSASLCSAAFSDQISLKNGDTLQGTLISQTESFVLWQSESFGEIQIPTNQVAFINPTPVTKEAVTTPEQNSAFKGNIGLSGAYLGGNEERDDLELDIGLIFENGNATHSASINYETLGENGESTINDYGIAYGIDWSISNRWYWGNNFFYGADDKRQIDQSVSVGTNVGYQFWKNETGKLSTAVGLTWINDKLFSATTDDRLTWAWSGDYEKLLIKKVSLSYSHQLNVSIKDSENTQLNADIGIVIPVTDKLDTKITWDWSFDNQPESGNETIDRKVRFGINYTL